MTEPQALRLSLGFGPGFGLFAGDKRLTIEHITIVILWLRIPGLGSGRLPGVRIYTVRVMALEEAPGLAPLLLECMTSLRRVPVAPRFLTQLGAPLGPPWGSSK